MDIFRFHHHHHRHQRIFDFSSKDLRLFDLSVWLHTFGREAIAIFIPILLLVAGYSLREVFIFYFLYSLLDVPLNFLARSLIQRIGARWVVALSSVFIILFFGGLGFIGSNNWLFLLVLVVLMAFYDTFYYVAYLYLFMVCSHHKKDLIRETTFMTLSVDFARVLAPVVGAVILIFFPKYILSTMSVVLLLFSVLPLYKIRHLKDKPAKKCVSAKKFFKNKDNVRDMLLLCFTNIHFGAEYVLWPVFVYLYADNLESVAIISVLMTLSAMTTYICGQVSKKKRMTAVAISSVALALIWFFRLSFFGAIVIIASTFVVGLISVFVNIPVASTFYERGENDDPLSYAMYFNASAMFGRIFLFGLLIFTTTYFRPVTIAFAGCSLLASALVARYFKSKKKKFFV